MYGVAMGFIATRRDLRSVGMLGIGALVVAGLVVGWLAARMSREQESLVTGTGPSTTWIVALALGVRLAFLLPATGFSDDFHRYVWEGRVVLAGENPYTHAPSDPVLESLRDAETWPKVTHADVPAAYPPLAQGVFAIAAATPWPSAFLRTLFLGCELLATLLLVRRVAGRSDSRPTLLLLAFAPLAIVEYAGSSHFDSLAILLVVIAWLAAQDRRPLGAVAVLALATLAKPFPVFLLPLLLRRGKWVAQLAIFAGSIVAAHLPFLADGLPYAGLVRYAAEWSFNAPLFPAVRDVCAVVRDLAFDQAWTAWPWIGGAFGVLVETPPERLARGVLAVAFLGFAAFQWFGPGARRQPGESRALRIVFALLVCSPVVHPWYVTWLIPFAALSARDGLSKSAWLWVVLAPLGYHVLPEFVEYGIWREDRVWRAIQYAPVLLSIAWVGCFSSNSGSGPLGVSGAERIGSNEAKPAQ